MRQGNSKSKFGLWFDEQAGFFRIHCELTRGGECSQLNLGESFPLDDDAVYLLALAAVTESTCDSFGFYWESKEEASLALKKVKDAVKRLPSPISKWPPWAYKAWASGWRPPLGRKPF
jgi:hypothetical protein